MAVSADRITERSGAQLVPCREGIGACPPSPWEQDLMDQYAAMRGAREGFTARVLSEILNNHIPEGKTIKPVIQVVNHSSISAPWEREWIDTEVARLGRRG